MYPGKRLFELTFSLVGVVVFSPVWLVTICLIALLDGEDEVTLQVACYDIGEFARFHEDGKRVIQQLGGKARLMRQMNSAHPKVAKQALLAVQKLLVTNWEVLTKSSE